MSTQESPPHLPVVVCSFAHPYTAGIGTASVVGSQKFLFSTARSDYSLLPSCRGFIGPVPPPPLDELSRLKFVWKGTRTNIAYAIFFVKKRRFVASASIIYNAARES
jgi:hypothetical protein